MKEKDYCGNTSEDEVVLKERRMRRPPKKFTPSSPKQDEISVIDLSGSDSKYITYTYINNKVQKLHILLINNKIYFFIRRSTKRTILPPPEQVSEKKKNTRRKKLYVTGDESFQDIEPLEVIAFNFFIIYIYIYIHVVHFKYHLFI